MEIGFVGNKARLDRVRKLLRVRFPEINPVYRENSQVIFDEELAENLKKLREEVDAVIFSGEVHYGLYVDLFHGFCPVSYFPRDSAGILQAMLTLSVQGVKMEKVSMDNYAYAEIQPLVEDMGMKLEGIVHVQRLKYWSDNQDYFNKMLDLHRTLYKEGKAEGVVTPISYVQETLKKEGIPAALILPTTEMMIKTIQDTLVTVSSSLDRQAGALSVLMLRLLPREELAIRSDGQFEEAIEKLRAAGEIYRFAKENRAIVVSQSDDQFTIVITAADLIRYTRDMLVFPLLQRIWDRTGCNFSLGIGVGYDPADSKLNAAIALKKASLLEYAGAFIAYDPVNVVGPLEYVDCERNKAYREQGYLLEIAEKTGISLARIERLMHLADNDKQSHITARELCDSMEISTRAANRILIALEENGYAVLVGHVSHGRRGRPYNVYRLMLEK